MLFLPFVEVVPEYQGRGIGSDLVSKMIVRAREKFGKEATF